MCQLSGGHDVFAGETVEDQIAAKRARWSCISDKVHGMKRAGATVLAIVVTAISVGMLWSCQWHQGTSVIRTKLWHNWLRSSTVQQVCCWLVGNMLHSHSWQNAFATSAWL